MNTKLQNSYSPANNFGLPSFQTKYTFKFLTSIVIILLSIYGCKKSTVSPTQAGSTANPDANPIYNKLGFGDDGAGQYANISATRGYVININALYASDHNRVIVDPLSNQDSYSFAGENSVAFTSALSASVNASGLKGLFKGSVSFYDSSYYKSDVIYAVYRLKVQQKHLKLNASTQLLMNYLTPEFKADLQTQSPAFIVSHYGTHCLTDIILGSDLEVMYHSNTTTSYENRKAAAQAGLGTALKTLFSLDLSGSTNQSLATTDYNQVLHYRTMGGNSSISLVGELDLDGKTPNKIQISQWQASITPENSELIDYGSSDGLILLSDLVADPVKSAALKTYIIQYLAANSIILVDPPVPIYQYYVPGTGPHAYSASMLPSINGNYLFSGQVFQAYTKSVSGAVPVYQFYNGAKNIWAYSTNTSPDLDGFTNEGIAFYAFTTQLSGTVPCYEYYYEIKSKKKLYYDTFYSTTNQIPGNDPSWHFESIVFYVYP